MQIVWPHHNLFSGSASTLDDDLSKAYQLDIRLSAAPLFSESPPSIVYLARCADAVAVRLIGDYIAGVSSAEETVASEYKALVLDLIALDINEQHGLYELSLLHVLVIKGHVAALTLLLDAYKTGPIRGSALDVDIADTRGFTAAHHAALLGRKDVITLLRENGADVMEKRNFRNGSVMDLLTHCWSKSDGAYSTGETLFHKYFVHPSILIEDWVESKSCEPNERQTSIEGKLRAMPPMPGHLKFEAGVVKATKVFREAEPIGCYTGQILPVLFANRVSTTCSIGIGGGLFIDGRHGSLLTRAARGHPNALIDSLINYRGLPQAVVAFATRDIEAGEEIFWDAIGVEESPFCDKIQVQLSHFWKSFDIEMVRTAREQYSENPTVDSYISTRNVEILYVFKNPKVLTYLLKEGILTRESCLGLFGDYERRISAAVFDQQMGIMAGVTRHFITCLEAAEVSNVRTLFATMYEMLQNADTIDEDKLLTTVFGALTETITGKKNGPIEEAICSVLKIMSGAARAADGPPRRGGVDELGLASLLEQFMVPMLAGLSDAAGATGAGDLGDLKRK